MSGRLIGDAYIVIYPQTDGFPAQLEAAVKKATAAVRPSVNVRPEVDKRAAAAVKAQLNALDATVEVTPHVSAAGAAAAREALEKSVGDLGIAAHLDAGSLAKVDAALKAQLAAFQSGSQGLRTDLSLGTKIDPASLAAAKATLQAYLDKNVTTAPVGAKIDPATLASMKGSIDAYMRGVSTQVGVSVDPARIAAAKASIDAYMKDESVKLTVEDQQAIAAVADLMERTGQLRLDLQGLKADVDDGAASRKLTALEIQARALSASLDSVGTGSDLSAFETSLAVISQKFQEVKASVTDADGEIRQSVGLFASLGLAGPGSLIHITDILNASLPEVKLFGGALGDMYKAMSGNELPVFASHLVNVATSAHLTTEAAIEFAAVWGPALIAVTAFGAAATPTVAAIGKQLQNMNTAAKGTGQAFQSLAMQGQSVVQAVKPSVLEAFGIALYAVQNHSSGLSAAMKTLGSDIDQMAAKAAVAFDKSSGTFFQQGTKDANALMQSFASLGSIFGTLMKAVPGYAEILLNFGNALLSVAATGAKFAEPVIAQFLKLHGALLYGGLTGTAAAWVFPKIVDAASGAALGVATAAEKILGSENVITKGALSLGGALEEASAGPVVAGVGLLVGAFTAIALYLKASSNAAKDFDKSIEASVSSSSLGRLQATISSGIQQVSVQYVQAEAKLSTALKATSDSSNENVVAMKAGTLAYSEHGAAAIGASSDVNEYKSTLVQLTAQQTNVNANLKQIADTFHTTIPGALAIASGAQITSNQLTASGAANWDTIRVQAEGYVTQLKVMTAGSGTLNQALNALNVTQSAQVTDAQKLASAYSTWIGIVTGGDSAFTTFEENFTELDATLSKNASTATTLYIKVGNLKDKYAEYGASMNGTTEASLAARQAFDGEITAATQLYGNLQTMAVVSNDGAAAQTALAKAGKDLIAQLLPLAAGSKEATAEVFALAQVAGYTGSDSFQALAKWVGNTKGAEADLNTQQTILTLSTANLTAAAKNLASAVGSEVTQAEAQAIARTNNFQQATLNLASALSQSQGNASAAVVTYATDYYNALIKAGVGANTAKQDVDAFLGQLGATQDTVKTVNSSLATLPKNVPIHIQLQTSGIGQIVISATGLATRTLNTVSNLFAAGGQVTGGVAGRDSVPIMAMPGEVVVPTHMVSAGAVDHLRGKLPGFAGGGLVGPVSSAISTAGSMEASFGLAAAEAFAQAAQSAAQAAAASAAQISLSGVSNTSAMAALQSAAAKAGWTGAQWTALYDVEMREAGFNLTAKNPSSGAYGMAQFINGPSEYAQYGGNSTTAAGQAVAMVNYIKSRYGTPEAAWAHEQQFGWYGHGGMINEPVLGRGAYSGRGYVFGESGPEAVMPASQVAGSDPGGGGLTRLALNRIATLMEQQNRLLAQMPYSQAQAINQAQANGVRRGYFATSGLAVPVA